MARAKRSFVYEQLFPETAGVEALMEAKRVPLDAIDANPDQPRRGELPGIPELARHIAEYGLLQPVVVTTPDAGRYTLIAGARRLAAFKLLLETDDEPEQWATIPALERETDSADRLVLAMAENIARHNLSDADTITSLGLLRDLRGWSIAEIARRLGTSDVWIHRHFSVAGDPALGEQVQAGALSVAKAYEVVRARTPIARAAALAAALGGDPLRVIRQRAQDSPALSVGEGPTRSDDPGPIAPAGEPSGRGETAELSIGTIGTDERVSPRGAWQDARGSDPSVRSDYGTGPVATAAPSVGPRDLAEAAHQLGLAVPLADLASTSLFFVAFKNDLMVGDGEALIKAMREDLRRLEGLVRTAQQGQRRVPAFPTG